jgi:citrate lyase subunit beta/citryl-CoA lyase
MRPVRSLLYVPANRRGWVENALDNGADGYIFDLEDAVPLDEKDDAREVMADELPGFADEDAAITVRVNPPDTGLMEADLDAIVGPGLDAVVVPKLPDPEVVRRVDHVLTYLERVRDLDDRVDVVALPETAEGFRRAYDLCAASDRVDALVGASIRGADVERALGFEWTDEGHERRYMLSKLVMDGRAAGVEQLISGPRADPDDDEGLRREARRARELGYTGFQVIHPKQIPVVEEVFTPDPGAVERYQELVEAMADAEAEAGRGAVAFEGEMVDLAHVERAEDVLERARAFGVIE